MRASKLLKKIIVGAGILLLIFALIAATLFFNEIRTLASLEQVDRHPFYTMTYYGDYGFDDFLKVGAESDRDIERFVMRRLLKGLEIDLNISSAACTVFTAANKHGERIYARNFDFDYAPALLVCTAPDNGYKSISMVNLSYAGYNLDYLPKPLAFSSFLTLAAPYLPFDGMNECGVAMALLAVPFSEPPQKPGQISLNTTTAIRLVLDKAANVDEAIELLDGFNYYFSGGIDCHYLIADSNGKSAVVEFMEGEIKVIESGGDYQVASNFILYNDLQIGDGYCEFKRYDTAGAVLQLKEGIITEKEAMTMLEEIRIPGRTQWSVVYNMSRFTAGVSINERYDTLYKFSLDR